MIDLKPVDILMIKSAVTKPVSSPQPTTNRWGEQIRMSGLDTAHRQFAITPEDKSLDK